MEKVKNTGKTQGILSCSEHGNPAGGGGGGWPRPKFLHSHGFSVKTDQIIGCCPPPPSRLGNHGCATRSCSSKLNSRCSCVLCDCVIGKWNKLLNVFYPLPLLGLRKSRHPPEPAQVSGDVQGNRRERPSHHVVLGRDGRVH